MNGDKQVQLKNIKKSLVGGEKIIGAFFGSTSISFFWVCLMGPFARFMVERYMVAITDKRVLFNKENSFFHGDYEVEDFNYEEIVKVKIGKRCKKKQVSFTFNTGYTLAINAPYGKKPYALSQELFSYMEEQWGNEIVSLNTYVHYIAVSLMLGLAVVGIVWALFYALIPYYF